MSSFPPKDFYITESLCKRFLSENENIKQKIAAAIDWCLTHGLLMRKSNTLSITHGPFSFFPTPVPFSLYSYIVTVAKDINLLVEKCSRDYIWLSTTLSLIAQSDPFISKLLSLYSEPEYTLGINRPDFMLSIKDDSLSYKLVEVNTIASSFISFSGLLTKLHKFILNKTSSDCYTNTAGLLDNEPIIPVCEIFAKANSLCPVSNSIILFVSQSIENNIYDQRLIEQRLLAIHGISTIRLTLREISHYCEIDSDTQYLKYKDKIVSVVYFRAGYTPDDYPSDQEWKGRELVSKSKSIQCPTVGYQLVASKKIQQQWCVPGELENFLSPQSAARVRSLLTPSWGMDDHLSVPYDEVLTSPENYVIKPQRQGGGNNIFDKETILEVMQQSKDNVVESNIYTLMSKIHCPPLVNILVRDNEFDMRETLSEIGIFGLYLGSAKKPIVNSHGGYLLRTKSSASNEGGVCSGFAVLDSMYLI